MAKVSSKTPCPEDLKVAIDFNNGVAVVPENAFIDNLPEGLTAKQVMQVDELRENFVAGLSDQLLDQYASTGAAVCVSDLSLGGKTTANIEVGASGLLLIEQTTAQGPAIAQVMEKSTQLSLSAPAASEVGMGEEDDDDE